MYNFVKRKEHKEADVLDERDAKHPKYSYSFYADHQISLIDKMNEGVHLIFAAAQLVSAADHVDDAGHETFIGTHAFHTAHGHNNEDQLKDALEKMNNLFNSMRRDLQTIRREFRRELRNTRREVTSMIKKFETTISKTDIAKTISINRLTVNTNLI